MCNTQCGNNFDFRKVAIRTADIKDVNEWKRCIDAFVKLGAVECEGHSSSASRDYSETYRRWKFLRTTHVSPTKWVTVHLDSLDGDTSPRLIISPKEPIEAAFGEGSYEPVCEWFGKKYKVTPETSELLQQIVFENGGEWVAGGREIIKDRNIVYIAVDESGVMYCGSSLMYFGDSELPEAKIELTKSIKIVEVVDNTKQQEYNKLQEQIAEMQSKMKELEEQAIKLKP